MFRYMKVLHFFREISCGKCNVRFYCNRNIIKLHERGMIEDIFPSTAKKEMTDLLNAEPQCVYAGFDPTARSLHVGNLLILVNLLHWQRGGHQVVTLVGGATGRIGDPSGRSKEREELNVNVVLENVINIKNNINRIFENHQNIFWKEKKEPLKPVIIVNNQKWYKELNSLDFVCNVGRHFRMGTMLGRNSVASRLESEVGLSFTEFAYQIFQAYDWFQLFKKYNCRFQIGGSDQMGNIMSGYELVARTLNKTVYGLTIPLVKSEEGNKYGKTAGNAVWLDAELTSPFELYQFFIRSKDDEVEKLLKLFTFNSLESIEDLCKKHKTRPELRLAQQKLANDMTLLVHGEEGLKSALNVTEAIYNSSVEKLATLSSADIENIFKGATVVDLMLRPGLTVLQFSMEAQCFRTEGDALRIINAGGFHINYQRVTNPNEVLTRSVHIMQNNVTLVRVGKKNYWVVRWT